MAAAIFDTSSSSKHVAECFKRTIGDDEACECCVIVKRAHWDESNLVMLY